MFKPGQIWDRTFKSGMRQTGLILKLNKIDVQIYVLDGTCAGDYYNWSFIAMLDAVRESRMSQLA